ncbi:hypothetical protein NITHO_6270003 [Nitrolancea hollandica Lb]|uniref:Uncharacterized protein n=1 Tax=Nitrolancea hollandica Lb TaxID=1129897 RepID=I4EMP1_9BACT|nr:hypothetical protein NITHO_6270003 [Nitrolancea hollandica Lb]
MGTTTTTATPNPIISVHPHTRGDHQQLKREG